MHFYGCKSLVSIHIPDSVTEIGSSAFSYCVSLASIHIPGSVTEIGEDAFYDHHPHLTIYGTPGSYVEEYAKRFKIKLEAE